MSDPMRFGRVEVRPRERELYVDGVAAGVGGRAFDLLLALIARRDRLVPKSELLDVVWPGLVVEENNLQVQVSTLRKLLGPQAIATVPGRGYKFTGAIGGAASVAAADGMGASVEPAPPDRRTNLPATLPVLYGRGIDVAALVDLLRRERVVTVVGAGGIGKSRLAQAAANDVLERHPDGVWIVDLAGVADASWLANTVASALSVTLAGRGPAREELVTAVQARRMLLVLDNVEHMLEAVGALVDAIRGDAPGVAVLATSQEPLHLAGEQQFRLLPLAVPAQDEAACARDFGAVALFEARVRAVDPRFILTAETTPLAIDICRRLDGLPLAIELAAARAGTLGLRAVRDKLDARFRLLSGGTRTPLRRHQTLRAALEWSHGLLNEGERTVFRRLGAFAGGFSMELAQAVAADERLDPWNVLEQLSGLVDKSLVVADAGEPPRYRLLDSARAFALEQLAAAGETSAILRTHATAMLALLRRVDDAFLDGEMQPDRYEAELKPELDNLRAAHEWADGDDGDEAIGLALAAHAGSLADYAPECADWLMPHREHLDAGGVADEIAARYWCAIAGSGMAHRLPVRTRLQAAERACSLYESLGKPRRMLDLLRRIALCRRSLGDEEGAAAALEQARSLIRSDWPAGMHARMLCLEGQIARDAGRMAEAMIAFRGEIALSATTGDWRLQIDARTGVIDLLWETGPIEEAAREARRLADELARRPAAVSASEVATANLFGILTEQGRLDEALMAARALLPQMAGINCGFLEEWMYFLVRVGEPAVAAMVHGALQSRLEATGVASQPNERRLAAKALREVERQLAPAELAHHRASGALLAREQLRDLLSDVLARAEAGAGAAEAVGQPPAALPRARRARPAGAVGPLRSARVRRPGSIRPRTT